MRIIAPFLTFYAVYWHPDFDCIDVGGSWTRSIRFGVWIVTRLACGRFYPLYHSFPPTNAGGAILHPSPELSGFADVVRDPMQGVLRRLTWHAPVWVPGAGGSAFVPGFVRKHVAR